MSPNLSPLASAASPASATSPASRPDASPDARPVLTQITNLGVTYPGMRLPALQGVNLTIRQGERLALIGQSGSGKSTLARALAGLLPKGSQISGRMLWRDGPPRPGRDFGYVFQDAGASLNPVLSIGAQLIEVIRTHEPMPRKAACARALTLLAQVQLPDPQAAFARYPHQLSGGQKQRCAIALAIAARPAILIADEATSALDMLVQAEIVALIDGLVQTMGMTLIFITHDIALAARLADHIAVLHHGQLVEEGAASALILTPQQDYTRALIAAHIDLSAPVLIAQTPEQDLQQSQDLAMSDPSPAMSPPAPSTTMSPPTPSPHDPPARQSAPLRPDPEVR